jgi:ABC-type lipoprotein release transport system permease subunit
VAGIFRSGLFEYDSTWIYVAFETAGAFAGNNHAASVMSVQVNDADNVKQVVRERFERRWATVTRSSIGNKRINRSSLHSRSNVAWVCSSLV